MKELDALMNALNERGIPKSLRMTAKVVPFPKEKDTPEKKQELLNEAVRHCLKHHLKEDSHLMKLFADFSFELAMNKLVEELDIKPPEKSPEVGSDDMEKLIAGLGKFLEELKNL